MEAQEKRKNISHYAIFDYWKDKCITKDGRVEIEIGYEGHDERKANVENSIEVVRDWGEPECWACRKEVPEYDYDNIDQDLSKVWKNKNVVHFLNKSHIVPHALGGGENPENMFLLCEECHKDSPDTKYKDQFFKWVYKRRHQPKKKGAMYLFEAAKRLEDQGLPMLLTGEEWSFETLNNHGGYIAPESYISAAVGVNIERWESIFALIRTTAGEKTEMAFRDLLKETAKVQTERIADAIVQSEV